MTAATAPEATVNVLDKPDLHITPAEIAEAFGRSPRWFDLPATRQRLAARGFPPAVSKGKWLREAVADFIRREYGARNVARASSLPSRKRQER